jgi:riboflavin biosynthesis pyrimidine reductase
MFTAPAAKHRNFLVTSDNESPIDDFRELQTQGFERILLESGPNLTAALATVIDEICVTVPNDSATPAFTALGIPRSTQLQHSLTVEGTTFMRFICT